jgi:hypothetical protein
MNSLWLIGLWERSRASRTIKHLCGKEDAVASAYSLYDYRIADDLGGYDAYIRLRDQAGRFGIRLASDMVPNHMGIDSPWVIDHPEWFLSRSDSPYPAYSFNGPDLSSDGRVEIKIEDHYYEQSDAAVVFRRRDKWTGDTRYVYHGNDGTSFPWNDTAQLDYLNPAVREQVIQTILDARIPVEFWREVVDRVATEVPGTLLLAEAFWMMEGYFVRTLGMHRVYNSAFMNLLRDEDNQHYRGLLKQTMEFDPGIMKRYVNFMSNPDERTAIDQFGTGDKCFGIATLMATLPGLPMFGHGQVEGFTEKYGMEYQRPRYDETPNQWLVDRHNREIAPLLHSRWLFAESDNFLLYDFWKEDGTVDENVYAYSNARGGQRALVIYHNRYGETRGTVHHSTGFIDKANGELRQRTLQDGLNLPTDHEVIFAFRDVSNGLEYLRRASDLHQKGFSIHLSAYKYHVFLHWRELRASREYPWDRLHDSLHGAGVPNLDEALDQLRLQPLHDAFRAALEPAILAKIIDAAEMDATGAIAVRQRETRILEAVKPFIERGNRFHKIAKQLEIERGEEQVITKTEANADHSTLLVSTLALPRYEALFPKRWPKTARKVLPSDSPGTSGTAVWAPVLAWSLLRGLPLDGVSAFDRLRLRHALADTFHALGLSGEDGWRAAARVRFLLHRARPLSLHLSQQEWHDDDVRWLTGTHDSGGVHYFNRESHEELLWWIQMPALVAATPSEQRAAAQQASAVVNRAGQAAKDAGYRLDRLLAAESRPGATVAARRASKAGIAKPSSKGKARPASSQDGAGTAARLEKPAKAKGKRRTKKSNPTKRKP